MGWPKGKPRGPRKPVSLDQLNSELNPTSIVTAGEDDQSNEGDQVITVGSDGIFGIRIESSLRTVVVLRRKLYKTETTIPYTIKGQELTKTYKPGDFGEWESNNATYHPSPESAIEHVAGLMRKMKLKEANDIGKYLQICKEVNQDLKDTLKV